MIWSFIVAIKDTTVDDGEYSSGKDLLFICFCFYVCVTRWCENVMTKRYFIKIIIFYFDSLFCENNVIKHITSCLFFVQHSLQSQLSIFLCATFCKNRKLRNNFPICLFQAFRLHSHFYSACKTLIFQICGKFRKLIIIQRF